MVLSFNPTASCAHKLDTITSGADESMTGAHFTQTDTVCGSIELYFIIQTSVSIIISRFDNRSPALCKAE